MRNGNLATVVQTLDNTLQRSDHYPADKYCKKQLFSRWIEIYKMDSVIHPLNNWVLESRIAGSSGQKNKKNP